MNKITTLLFGIFLSMFVVQAQAQNYIWGGPGDPNSEFADGLNDWTVEGWATGNGGLEANDKAVFTWEANGSAESGLFAGPTAVIQSPSVGNGAMVFNSDFMDTRGRALGSGAAPRPQIGHLISPEFSCEGRSSVVVHFNQSARQFGSAFYLDVSIDGGANWEPVSTLNKDPFPPKRDIRTNRGNSPDAAEMVDISAIAANQSKVQIRFRIEANLYFWILDDVWVMENPENDLVLGDCLYAPSNWMSPQMSLTSDSFFFAGYIHNRGTTDQKDLELQAFILDSDGNPIFGEAVTIDNLPVGDTMRVDFEDAQSFMPTDLAEGVYFLGYRLVTNADNDYNPTDNVYVVPFNVSKAEYQKTFPQQSTAYRPSGADDFGFAGIFVTGDDGGSYEARSAEMALAGDVFGNPDNYVSFFLLEMREDYNDPYFNTFNFEDEKGIDGNNEFIVLGSGEAPISAQSPYRNFKTELFNDEDDSEPLCLKPNRTYLMLANLAGLSEGTAFMIFDEGTIELHGYENIFPKAQIPYLILTGEDWGTHFGGTTGAPVINMQMRYNKRKCKSTANKEVELAETSVSVSPNPTSDYLQVNLNFEKVNSGSLVLTSIDGNVITRRTFENVQTSIEIFEVNGLPAGSYIMNIHSDLGLRSIPFVVE